MSYFITLQTFSVRCKSMLFPCQSSNNTVSIPDLCFPLYFWYKHLELLFSDCVFNKYIIRIGDLLNFVRSKTLLIQLTQIYNLHFVDFPWLFSAAIISIKSISLCIENLKYYLILSKIIEPRITELRGKSNTRERRRKQSHTS